MDQAEKYQQRLQAMVERRRQQEEDEKLRREIEEEWLKTAQEKRKYLREQWLSGTAPAPVHPSLDISGPRTPQQDEAAEHTAAEQTKSQKTPEDEEAADAREEKQTSQEENKEFVNCAAAARTHNHYQTGTDKDTQVNKEAENYFSIGMAQRMFYEGGEDGRSVLGSLAVQVERDHRTGATIIRSVSPVASPSAVPMATTVFDDGRKSVHAVGGVEDQPSTEELGQILNVIEEVGMKVLLDEVTVTPDKEEIKIENVDANKTPEEELLSISTSHEMPFSTSHEMPFSTSHEIPFSTSHEMPFFTSHEMSFSTSHAISDDDNVQLDSSKSYNSDTELGKEDGAEVVENKEDNEEDRSNISNMVVKDIAKEVDKVEDQTFEEGPVSLVFLGYTESTTDQSHNQEDHDGMLTVERVIITEEGEELVLEPDTSASPQDGKESQNQVSEQEFQDIPLEGNGAAVVQVQVEEVDKGAHHASLPSIPEAGGTSKRKTCQCCSIM